MKSFIESKTDPNVNNFDKIAHILLNDSILLINSKSYRICEIEFYLHNDSHKDQYVHMNHDQLSYGSYYFHKYKTGTYKSGTYKGLDITLGNHLSHSYCGILIRSIYDISNKILIEGPCRSVNKILEEYNCISISDFTNTNLLSVLSNKNNFVIKDIDKNNLFNDEIIYKGIRVGLSDKYSDFKNKKYRYLIMKDLIKKQKSDLSIM